MNSAGESKMLWEFPNGQKVRVSVVGRVGRSNTADTAASVIVEVVEPGVFSGLRLAVEENEIKLRGAQ